MLEFAVLLRDRLDDARPRRHRLARLRLELLPALFQKWQKVLLQPSG